VTVDGRLFHALVAATRNARSPSGGTVASRGNVTTSVVEIPAVAVGQVAGGSPQIMTL